MSKISVLIPAFNEEAMIEKTAKVIHSLLLDAQITDEIIFIDDGSKDNTWEKIEVVSEEFDCVKGIHFSRNFRVTIQ